MPEFKRVATLAQQWAEVVGHLEAYIADPLKEQSVHRHLTLTGLQHLVENFDAQLRDAISIVSHGEGSVNGTRTQQITQYHRNRLGKLEKQLHRIDDALETPEEGDAMDAIAEAALRSERQDVLYQIKDHTAKVDRRGHGVHLTKMRRKHG